MLLVVGKYMVGVGLYGGATAEVGFLYVERPGIGRGHMGVRGKCRRDQAAGQQQGGT